MEIDYQEGTTTIDSFMYDLNKNYFYSKFKIMIIKIRHSTLVHGVTNALIREVAREKKA